MNLILRSLGVGLPGLSRLNLTLDHTCTHGTLWTTFAGLLPDDLCSDDAALLHSGCRALYWFRSAYLLPTGTCQTSHGILASAIGYRPAAVAVACAASVPNRPRPYCAVAAIFSDCFTTGNFSGCHSSSSTVNNRRRMFCARYRQLFTPSHCGCRDRL